MNKRDLNISFSKSGAGNITPKLTLPKNGLIKWILLQKKDKLKLNLEKIPMKLLLERNKKISYQFPYEF